jgi:transposase
MTIKEIAELCGVDSRTIYRWAEKAESLNDKMSLRNKIGEGSPENPADFTLEETLAIIGEGGGNKTLASLLAENAVTKNALAVQSEVEERGDRITDGINWATRTFDLRRPEPGDAEAANIIRPDWGR